MGTTTAQKKLFFNLARLKAQLKEIDSGISPEAVRHIATELDVSEAAVVEMNSRLSATDTSLNASTADGETAWQDRLADDREDQESELTTREERRQQFRRLALALPHLSAREQEIVRARYLREEPLSLAELAARHGVTSERIRQVETQAVAKLKTLVKKTRSATMPLLLEVAA
jgi:RNA polymerase sigma-32 factor